MNQGFRLRFDQMRESDPTNQPASASTPSADHYYNSPGHTRNLCLIWPNGRQFFLNYAFLIGGEFDPAQEKNVIKLNFTAYTATLVGYGLEPLSLAFVDHLPRLIYAVDERYVLEEDRKVVVVVEMAVVKNDG